MVYDCENTFKVPVDIVSSWLGMLVLV